MSTESNHKPIVFAHRGASGYEHDNSFSAFDKAIEQGADGLETDCWFIADGSIVLHHDKAINVPGQEAPANISKLNLSEVKSCVFPNGETVPTIQEFFDRYKDTKAKSGKPLYFSIDLQDMKVGQALAPIIEQYCLVDRVFLCGSTTTTLKKVRAASATVKLVASNIDDQINPENLIPEGKIAQLQLIGFNVNASTFKPEMKDILTQAGLKCFIWDLHTEELLKQYLPYRPDAIYSNYPDLALKIRAEVL